jgi:hypothetical protein
VFTTSKWQRPGFLFALVILAAVAACSGGSNPSAIYPASGSSSTIAGSTSYQLPAVNGVNSTMSIQGTGTLTVGSSASAPSVGAIPMVKQRSQVGPANSSLIYYTVTATSALTITGLNVEVGFPAQPTMSVYLAYWNGTEWVASATSGSWSGGVETLAVPGSALPLSLSAGQSLYLVAYEGQQVGTPPPPPPAPSPASLSIDLLTSTPVTVTSKAGFTITAVSSNADVATVTPSATVGPNGTASFTVAAAQQAGTATITFTDSIGQTGTMAVTVVDALPSPAPSPGSFVISTGDSTLLNVSTIENLTITATSSNTSVATVSTSETANGSGTATFTVTGVASGVATLTFTDKFGDMDTATVDVSPIQNGTFTSSTGSGTLGAWQPCSYTRTSLTAAINPSPPPKSTDNQAPPASTTPEPNVANYVGIVTPPPNYNPTILGGAASSVPSYIGSNVALAGGSPAPGTPGGEVASVTAGAVGICQTVTLDTTNHYLSFWVYEASGSSNFGDGDQEAVILNAPNGAPLNTTTPTDSYLFAELNCFMDPGSIGLSTFSKSSSCVPSAYGGTSSTANWQGGFWTLRGPYDLLSTTGNGSYVMSAGTQFTLFFGTWYFETKAFPATFGMAMFIANVQMANTSAPPTVAPFDRNRRASLTMPVTRARASLGAKLRP